MDEDERASPQIWLGDVYAEHPEPDSVLTIARQHNQALPVDLSHVLRIDLLAAPARALPPDHEHVAQLMRLFIGGQYR